MTTIPAIGFEYRASRMLAVATAGVALLSMVAVATSGIPPWLRLGLIACMGISGGWSATRVLRPRVQSVLWRDDGSVELRLSDSATSHGREVHGSLQGARVLGSLIVLTLRWQPRGRASLWLLPDNLDADPRRRLRMRLGTQGGGVLASGNADNG